MVVTNHVVKGMKYRLYPNASAKEYFAKAFGCARKCYNLMLEDCNESYKTTGKVQICQPTKFKNQEQYAYMKEIDAFVFANERIALNNAFRHFHINLKKGMPVKEAGLPNFKKKYSSKQTFTTNNQASKIGTNTIRFEKFNAEKNKWESVAKGATHILLPKIGRVNMVMHRPLPENCTYSSVTVTKTPSGKYYVSICVQYDEELVERNLNLEHSIGLDYSSPYFFVDNQANKGDYQRYFRLYEKKIALLNKSLSRKQKHSKNYEKTKLKLAKAHEKIANRRNDWQWKKAQEIADNPHVDYVFVETLRMQEIAERDSVYKLGKSTYDNGWYSFVLKLSQKLFQNGKELHLIDRWYPSSKTCSQCGNVIEDLGLDVRTYVCPKCGLTIDRDVNSAINLRNKGIELVSMKNIMNRRNDGNSLPHYAH